MCSSDTVTRTNVRAVGVICDYPLFVQAKRQYPYWNFLPISPVLRYNFTISSFSPIFPTTGMLLFAYLHNHPVALTQSFVLTSTPERLGFKKTANASFSMSFAVSEIVFSRMNASIWKHKELKCWQPAKEEHQEVINNVTYFRYRPTLCKQWHFIEGETFTVVALTPPVSSINNHNSVRFVYLPTDNHSIAKLWPTKYHRLTDTVG